MSVLIRRERAQMLVIDMQERLLPAMTGGDEALAACEQLVQAAARLHVPVTVSQQYPKGIGATVEALARHLPADAATLDKMTFSCMGDTPLRARIEALAGEGRDQVIVCGVEAHVCVLQTAIDIAEAGLQCFVVADAIASRAPSSKEIALQRMARAGVGVATAEMVIFECLGVAGTADFKALMPLVK